MSMDVGGKGVKSEINVTPLVDVVLVLLIIFMVVTPLLQMGYDTTIPPEVDDPAAAPPQQNADQVIVRMDKDAKYYINKEQIGASDFPFRLSQTLQGRRASQMTFFAADGELRWEQVSEFMDLCYNNGAVNMGIVFDDLEDAAAAGAPGP